MVTADRSKWPPHVVGVRPHAFKQLKGSRFHWPVCRYCGIVALKNAATKKAIRLGCYRWDDE